MKFFWGILALSFSSLNLDFAVICFGVFDDGAPIEIINEADYIIEEHNETDVTENLNHFFVDHATAMKIPTKVLCFTTADFYREGFRMNCTPILNNDLSTNDLGYIVNNVTDEQRLLCKLLHNYSPTVRPVSNLKSTMVVNFSLALNQIFDLDDRNQQLILGVWYEQTWIDDSLKWDPDEFGGIRVLNIPSTYIFLPDIELYNTAADYSKRRAQFRAMVSNDGTVFYGNPSKLFSTCHVNPTWFPFDTQVCHLKFGSWTYSGFEIDLQPSRSTVDTSRLITHGKWDVVEVVQRRHAVVYTCCPEPYIDISYYIILRRRPLYYLLNVYFFTVMLAVMTLAVYQLPITTGEKCGLGTAVLFSVSVFMLSLGEKLPESSDYVPFINIYLFIIMAMSAISLMITIGIHAIHFQQLHLDPKTKKAEIRRVPPFFMRLVRYHRKRRGKWVDEVVEKAAAKYKQKKDIIRKLRSYQRNIDFEMRHLPYTRPLDSPPFFRKSKTFGGKIGALSELVETPSRNNLEIASLHQPDLRMDFYLFKLIERVNEISVAIEHLADSYETQINRAFSLVEWHELGEALDRILFWIFLVFLLVAITFVFGFASQSGPDGQAIIDNFEHRHETNGL